MRVGGMSGAGRFQTPMSVRVERSRDTHRCNTQPDGHLDFGRRPKFILSACQGSRRARCERNRKGCFRPLVAVLLPSRLREGSGVGQQRHPLRRTNKLVSLAAPPASGKGDHRSLRLSFSDPAARHKATEGERHRREWREGLKASPTASAKPAPGRARGRNCRVRRTAFRARRRPASLRSCGRSRRGRPGPMHRPSRRAAPRRN